MTLTKREILNDKKDVIREFLTKMKPNSKVDRWGHVKYEITNGDGKTNTYRFKLMSNVIRHERYSEDIKTWFLIRSYNLNQVHKKAIAADKE